MKCLCTGYKGLLTNFEEKWKPVVGFEGQYEVSSHGQVKSLSRWTRGTRSKLLSEIVMKKKINKGGYECVHLRDIDGKSHHPTVHRLVAEIFIPNPENKGTVNHIDGDKRNNDMFNLEWATEAEQWHHAKSIDVIKTQRSTKFSPEFKQSVKDYYDSEGCSIVQLSKVFEISERSAGRIANNDFNNRKSKISNEDVITIRLLRSEGWTLEAISEKYNCGISQIHRITTGQSRNIKYERN